MTSRRVNGFTLLEVLVALAIIGLGLAAALRASTLATSGAETLRNRTLALWVAEDRLAHHGANRSQPVPGVQRGVVTQANLAFQWQETVTAADPAGFQRIEIAVAVADAPGYALARLTAFAPPPPRQRPAP